MCFRPRCPLAKVRSLTLALLVMGVCGQLAAQSEPHSAAQSAAQSAPLPAVTNGLGMKLVKIPAGSFQMGTAAGAPLDVSGTGDPAGSAAKLRKREAPAHQVRISRPFYLQTTVVTQKQWQAVMGTTPWADKKDTEVGDDYPAVHVSWNDVQAFIQKRRGAR